MGNSHLTDRAMRAITTENKMKIAAIVAMITFMVMLLSYCAGRIRERQEQAREQEHEYTIPLEVWQEFQDCIEPHPSDGVCDSCWKAIIIDKYHITTN